MGVIYTIIIVFFLGSLLYWLDEIAGEFIGTTLSIIFVLILMTWLELWTFLWWSIGLYIGYKLIKSFIKNKQNSESWFSYIKRLLTNLINKKNDESWNNYLKKTLKGLKEVPRKLKQSFDNPN
ncbi:hypothetical protein G6702_06805 [Polynucleobacter paneuropaeus]|nr:hypothetical protein G6703_02155 [Polynucleobacter paneuropaeus]QWD15660.1 hypothetical protein G6702_06805 [Polynucleobacter paneuropaeus]